MVRRTIKYVLYTKNPYDGGLWPVCNRATSKNINYSSLDSALMKAYNLCANDDDGSVEYVGIRNTSTYAVIGKVQYKKGGIYFYHFLGDIEKAYLLHKTNGKIKKELLKIFDYRY